jgi:DNA-binding transcriptional ArsR family regulator
MVRVSEGMDISRQSGAKHVSVLREAGLVSLTRSGREQIVSLDRTHFLLAEMFMRQMEAQWDDRLSTLTALIEA